MGRANKCLLLAAGAVLVGCGPTVSREELGNVVYEIPNVPGAEVPYALPAMDGGESPGGAAPSTPPAANPQTTGSAGGVRVAERAAAPRPWR